MKHNAEMAEHANVAAQFMDSLVGGQYVTKENDSAPPNEKTITSLAKKKEFVLHSTF